MKILGKTLIPIFLATAILASCNSFISTPTTSPTNAAETATVTVSTAVTTSPDTNAATIPVSPATTSASPTPLVFSDPSAPMSEQIIYYYFVTIAEDPRPEGSVVIMPDMYILAPTLSDITYSPDTAANLKNAMEAVLKDGRNGWVSDKLEIVDVAFGDDHADLVLQGEYFGVGDVTLIAARMQILMTVFANPYIQTAAITLNGDTIGNLGVSNSMNAKPADYVFTRSEIDTFMNEHANEKP